MAGLGIGALTELARMAGAGSMRGQADMLRKPVLTRCGFVPAPVVGEASRLQMQSCYAASARVRAFQDEAGVLFDGEANPNSSVPIQVASPEPIKLLVTLVPHQNAAGSAEPTVHQFVVTPKLPSPRFKRIDVPARDGVIMLRLVAQGAHSASTELRRITIGVHAPAIEVTPRTMLCGVPGSEVSFHWRITDARSAWLEARNDRHPVGLEDGFAVTIGHDAEHFRLVAASVDQRRETVKLSVVPHLLGFVDEPED